MQKTYGHYRTILPTTHGPQSSGGEADANRLTSTERIGLYSTSMERSVSQKLQKIYSQICFISLEQPEAMGLRKMVLPPIDLEF